VKRAVFTAVVEAREVTSCLAVRPKVVGVVKGVGLVMGHPMGKSVDQRNGEHKFEIA
jgi:hypothetical protein